VNVASLSGGALLPQGGFWLPSISVAG
jgi:hypothetical protein